VELIINASYSISQKSCHNGINKEQGFPGLKAGANNLPLKKKYETFKSCLMLEKDTSEKPDYFCLTNNLKNGNLKT